MRGFWRMTALLLAVALLCPFIVCAAGADLNEDGTTDERDAVYLLYHTLLPADYPLTGNADYDANGTVDMQDALRLLYHTLLPNEYPLWNISLPAVGYDPDGKGRIQLVARETDGATATFTFQNLSRSWVTEETSSLTYVCTAADGTVLKTDTLFLGYMKYGTTVTRTLPLPDGTVTVAFTACDIPYWSIWL